MSEHTNLIAACGWSEDNERRIVACINACAGVSTEWLEREKNPVLLGAPISARFRELERQRDDLLSIFNLINIDKDGDGFICRDAMEQVLAVMEKVGAGETEVRP